MIVQRVEDIVGTPRDVHGDGWKSRRLLLAEDGLPFSVHETTVAAGTELRFCYGDHSETVYCVAGKGTVENVATGEVHRLTPGVLYSVGIGDEHVLQIEDETTFLCVFSPALEGDETAT